MSFAWNLKKWLAVERDIYRPSELQALLAEKAGVQLSLQAVSALINGKPEALRIQTIQALCNALNCKLSDFCDVWPDSAGEQQKQRKVVGGAPVRLHVGCTKDVERRIAAHNAGRGGRYTRSNRPLTLIATWPFSSAGEARRAQTRAGPGRFVLHSLRPPCWLLRRQPQLRPGTHRSCQSGPEDALGRQYPGLRY